MKKIQHGFTLIELMVAIAILGIMVAVALPTYTSYMNAADAEACLVEANAAKFPYEIATRQSKGDASSLNGDSGTLIGLTASACDSITLTGAADGSGSIAGAIVISSVAGAITYTRDANGDWSCDASGSADTITSECP